MPRRSRLRSIALLLLLPLTSACSVTASITPIDQASIVEIDHAGFVSASSVSTQNEESLESHYGIQASVGSMTNKISDRTPNGSLVYTSNQGALLSDETALVSQQHLSVPAQ